MDIHLGLFSQRLRRLLAGEEGTLPDPAKQHIQNLQTEINIVASWLRDYEDELIWLLLEIIAEEDEFDSPNLKSIMEEINCFALESDKVIDTFIIIINQQNSQSCSNDFCDALLGFQSKIIAIKKRMQQVQHIDIDINDMIKLCPADAGNSPASSSFKQRDTVGLDDRMEELLDLLIEGPPQLSIVAILDSVEVDKTAITSEAYNSNFVKHYFDCHAWVPVSPTYDSNAILDGIMKFLMPSSRLSEVTDENSEMKKIILHDYLINKRYLIVLDDMWDNYAWDLIWEILPDNQNGSRVLITVSQIEKLTSFQLENGENNRLDFVPSGGPVRVMYQGRPLVIIYYGSMSLKENIMQTRDLPLVSQVLSHSMLPLYLKLCCLYLSVFPGHSEISTRQLYQLWIAEGFIPDNSEATAQEYLKELIDRGFIQVRKRRPAGSIKTCYIGSHSWPAIFVSAQKVGLTDFLFEDQEIFPRKTAKRFAAYLLRSCIH